MPDNSEYQIKSTCIKYQNEICVGIDEICKNVTNLNKDR